MGSLPLQAEVVDEFRERRAGHGRAFCREGLGREHAPERRHCRTTGGVAGLDVEGAVAHVEAAGRVEAHELAGPQDGAGGRLVLGPVSRCSSILFSKICFRSIFLPYQISSALLLLRNIVPIFFYFLRQNH